MQSTAAGATRPSFARIRRLPRTTRPSGVQSVAVPVP